jgi:N-acetylglucosaminyl-diphospho-decaprenol L-rhamnosyltransferase
MTVEISQESAAPAADPPRPAHEIVVSIINYRTGEMTIDCVKSVLADIGALDVHVAVVDNRSDDGSADRIAAWIEAQSPRPPVSLVRSATNSGYSGGHNQGMGYREAEAYLILNSDAVLRPGALSTLLEALRADPGRVSRRRASRMRTGRRNGAAFAFPRRSGSFCARRAQAL